ncbi:Os06g0541132 [Oryza sativa Japonica Group]|uniref:Os06g0541132 protein n=2 Tax=Oryza TaxID=4527 RepID=A0A0P0WXU3_ORYSJ|nr:hypothetical protein EE612_034715 [Oryza sativa]BAS98128.1 Os06g0541132 [Oryza sativa Japonica Group]
MVVVVSIFSIVRCMRKEEAAVRATCQEIAVMDIDLRTRPVADPSSFTPMKRFAGFPIRAHTFPKFSLR